MKYRKKPVVIEAYQTDKELDIETLEGTMRASVGDYIITGVRGEKYPCKPYIFEQTYEPADVPAASPWHRVEEPPKDACDCLVCWTTIHDEETGEVTGHGFWCEKGWYEDGLLGEVGFYCQRREETHPVRVEPDYWMPIEPPKEVQE